jgi:glycine dehydrogenase subunit 1
LREQLLKELGLSSLEELFRDIPKEFRIEKLNLPPPLSEQETGWHLGSILAKNRPQGELLIFLGGGCWFHFIPAHIRYIVGRGEFLTSYTPYQSEVSQGLLQALFEYQSLIAELVGLEIANASMYDWATALGEAALMASRVTKRNRILIPHFISPERRSVLENYCQGSGVSVTEVLQNPNSGQLELEDLKSKLDENVAAVYIETPSYLGFVEEQVEEISEMAHRAGALFIVGVNPIALALFKPPGEYGADIVVGEGQHLGQLPTFGGPSLGIFACRDDRRLVRQLPGRLVGMTTTVDGRERAFCMVLQTREQHIRRERATSNICSNEALCAIAAAAYLASMGPEGLRTVASISMANAHYLMKRLSDIPGLEAPAFRALHFNEFVLIRTDGGSIREFNRRLLQEGIHGGHVLVNEFPELGESELVCTTEVHSKRDLDRFVEAAARALGGGR